MELPHLGEHCSEASCKQLDYLPMKCDACNDLFCKDHLMYDDHVCKSKYKKDVQVPVCPLCSAPVPVARGTVPDLAVSAHIDQACRQKVKEKVFTNKCNKHKCKKKELVKITCDSCKLNFCLTHRHPKDHDCEGPKSVNRLAASAADRRAKSTSSSTPSNQTQSKITNFFSGPFRTDPSPRSASIGSSRPAAAPSRPAAVARPAVNAFQQQNMSEDEALAAALAASMQDVPAGRSAALPHLNGMSQEEQDRLLAQALQESERSANRSGAGGRQHQTSDSASCNIS